MKMIRFSQTFWHVVNGASQPQFAAGKDYPVNEDTLRCVARGIAEEVDVQDEPVVEPPADAAATPPVETPAPAAAAAPSKSKK